VGTGGFQIWRKNSLTSGKYKTSKDLRDMSQNNNAFLSMKITILDVVYSLVFVVFFFFGGG
jgi:hypothetical protein